MIFQDSIVSLSSGRLPSGVAVVRLSGPGVRRAVETITGSLPTPRIARYGQLRAGDGSKLDDALTLFFPGPHSFTGEDSAEFHVHGGRAVVSAILERVGELDGFRQAEPGEFTRRAFLNGKLDLLEAEALADLISAETEAQRRFAASNSEGRQSELYMDWRRRLIHARAMIEAEMDFADEDDIPGSVSSTIWADVTGMIEEIRDHLAGFRRAEIIRDGFDVLIIGAPNAGKSSLLNALAKRDVAIVTDEAGTTRDLVEVVLDLDGLKVRLTDTAGLREGAGKVEAIGIARAIARARNADLVLEIEDLTSPVAITELVGLKNVLRIGTKIDLAGADSARAQYDHRISVVTGQGIAELIVAIGAKASMAAGDTSDVLPSRQRHVELLRTTASHLETAMTTAAQSLDLASENLRLASDQLGRISGAIAPDDLLDVIYSHFCIGK
ncbi:tRNA uridine-5-carboxymethylaminomethyl(34) synthesis GTPase MnmE [Pseudaminobacter sp. NGMCC 1.201702]|uniref:tRNA uridine-5-carboxymethylaminomethyl(34) synthesis GTPase MnmE n=1 Tax=Pseudaminobacter sp. NGMCC 1.201702 TaxID=3391825 RepID=UPI0039EEB98A